MLTFVFASFLAIIPIFMAVVSIMTTFLLLLGLTELTSVSPIVQFLIALLGLGVAIDYSLIVVSRWREERSHGRSGDEAVQKAMETAGRAVVFSGITVAIGLLALIALPLPFLRSMGYGGMLIPLVSTLVAITLLPVVLAKVGLATRLAAPPHGRQGEPRLDALGRDGRPPPLARGRARAWRSCSRSSWPPPTSSSARPTPTPSPSRATPATAWSRSRTPASARARCCRTRSWWRAAAIRTRWRRRSARSRESTARWRRTARSGAATGPRSSRRSRSRTAAPPRARTRSTGVREAAHAVGPDVRVGGQPASNADFIDAVYGSFPLMIALITITTFILLARAFRSLLLPAKAIMLNILSVAAAWGVLVLVWQHGYGSELIWGIEATGSIPSWMPLMIFAFLFGLSMDYEVFILARMREEYDRTGSTEQAVITGIGRTGRLVTSAALILFLTFVAMGSSPGTDLKMFATGLGAGHPARRDDHPGADRARGDHADGPLELVAPEWPARVLRVEPSVLQRRVATGEGEA